VQPDSAIHLSRHHKTIFFAKRILRPGDGERYAESNHFSKRMKSPQATILGKQVYVYDSGVKATIEEVEAILHQYDRLSLLRVIADLGSQIHRGGSATVQYGKIPINDDFLTFSALIIINYSTFNNQTDAGNDDLQFLFGRLLSLYDQKIDHEALNGNEILLRIAYSQFQYQNETLNALSRTIYMYKHIWPKRKMMIEHDIFVETLGISFDHLFFHAFSVLASDNYYFYKNTSEIKEQINTRLGLAISEETENAFLAWSAASLGEITAYQGPLENALHDFPIVETGIIPPGGEKEVFLLITKNCLRLKLAQYLYFDFIDKYSDSGKGNVFKQTYGIAFQEYIGVLLNNHFRTWDVIPEIKYLKKKNQVDTVDWILRRNDRVVLIEVKQSSVFLNTKISGSLESFKLDCRNTLCKAFTQLNTTRDDIISGAYPELESLRPMHKVELLCVVADPLYFGNMLLPELGADFPQMHVINIADFEDLLEIQKNDQNLHYLLDKKRKKGSLQAMDFKEYNVRLIRGKNQSQSQFLRNILDGYFASLGLT
jgi:hypothetical protein